jgi:hypothetical protein
VLYYALAAMCSPSVAQFAVLLGKTQGTPRLQDSDCMLAMTP